MAPSPPPSRKGLYIGCALAVLFFFGLFGGIAAVAIRATAGPRAAGHDLLGHLRASDYRAAWSSTSEELRNAVDEAEFEEGMKHGFPEAHDSTDATFNQTQVSGNRACLAGSLDTPSGSVPVYMRLVNERGVWRVSALGKAPVPGC